MWPSGMVGCPRARHRRGRAWWTRSWRSGRNWSTGRMARSARTSPTRRSLRWGMPGRSGRPAGRWPSPGGVAGGAAAILFCLWLAWSRFRLVLLLWDKAQPSVVAAVDAALRRLGGCPTYLLTDNEKTVTVEHVAGVPVRNPATVQFARHYGLTVATCVPADPASKGGSEATVRVAKADLVPTEANLLDDYASFGELEAACARVLRSGQRPGAPDDRPGAGGDAGRGTGPAASAAGDAVHRGVRGDPPGRADHAAGRLRAGAVLGAAHPGRADRVGPPARRRNRRRARRRRRPGRGRPARGDHAGHPAARRCALPARAEGALHRTPKPKTTTDAAFLAIGDGAQLWLVEAAAAGTGRIRAKMAEAVELARLHEVAAVDRALGEAAAAGRFGDGDLAAILTHQASAAAGEPTRPGA